jgi:hypothetical protein
LRKIFSFFILIMTLLSACSSPAQPPTAIPLITVLPTFSDIPPTAVPPTAIIPTVVPPTAVPLFFDDFSDNQETLDAGWYIGKKNGFGWIWSPNTLKGYASKGEVWTANGPTPITISNYALQVQAQPTGVGYAEYGIFFRAKNLEGGNYYVFTITTEGKYAFAEFGKGTQGKDAIPYTDSEYIHIGNSANILAVIANRDQIDLYINGFQVANLTNVSIATGKLFGLFVRSSRKERAEVEFSQFTVFTAGQAKAIFGAAP